jgi:uncharacterized protein (TIRG00374 family)
MIPRALALSSVVAITAMGYVGAALWVGFDEVIDATKAVGPGGLAIGLMLTVANIFFRFVRWQGYLRIWNHEPRPWISFQVYVAGFALAATPGGAGEPVVRGMFLKRYGVSYPQTFAAYFAERTSDVIVIVGLATLGLYAYAPARPLLSGIAAGVLGLLLFLARPDWLYAMVNHFRRRSGRLAAAVVHGLQTGSYMRDLSTLRPLLAGLALGTIAWTLQGIAFYVIVHALGAQLSFQIALFVYALSALVGALSFLPGGLGTAEVSMIGLLVLFGLTDAHAVASTILIRLVTLWFAVGLGIWGYIELLRRRDVTVPPESSA